MLPRPFLRSFAFWAVAAAGLAVSVGVLIAAQRWETWTVESRFRPRAVEFVATIRAEFDRALADLGALKSFFEYAEADGVAERDFTRLARALEGDAGVVRWLAWAPHVEAEGPNGQFLIRQLEPHVAGTLLNGYDLASRPSLRDTLEQARRTGLATAAPPFEFRDGNDTQPIIIVVAPRYARVTDDAIRGGPLRRVTGFFGVIIRCRDLVTAASARVMVTDLAFVLRDAGVSGDDGVLCASTRDADREPGALDRLRLGNEPSKYRTALNFAGRRLDVAVSGGPLHGARRPGFWPAVVAALGFLLTVVFVLRLRRSWAAGESRPPVGGGADEPEEGQRPRLDDEQRRARAAIPVVLIDPSQPTVVAANSAACRYFAGPGERLEGRSPDALFALGPDVLLAMLEDARRGRHRELRAQCLRPGGDPRQLEVQLDPLHLEGQTLVLMTAHEVAVPPEDEGSPHPGGAEMEGAFQQLPPGVVVLRSTPGAAISVECVTVRASELLPRDARQVLSSMQATAALVHPEDRAGFVQAFETVRATLQPAQWEGRVVVDGRTRRLYVAAEPCVLDDGSSRWTVVLIEIAGPRAGDCEQLERQHERVRALEAAVDVRTAELAACAARFRSLAEQPLVGVYITRDGTLRYANPGLAALFGFATPAAMIHGLSLEELVTPDDRALVSGYLERQLSGQLDALRYVFSGVRTDGSRIAVETYGCRLQLGDSPSVIGIMLDVSERAGALAAAEQLSCLKAEFLANVNHELRTPLNGILGMAALGLRSADPRKAREALERIAECGCQLRDMVENLLDFSALENGVLELVPGCFDPVASLEGIAQRSRDKSRAKGLDFRMHVGSGLPRAYVGDERRIGQVVALLLDNAVKFTEKGGIGLVIGRCRSGLRLCVYDTGIGIAPDRLARLFRPFEQGDGSATRRFGGAGLGLALCRFLVERMGGRIRVRSKAGHGSAFEVRLPLPEGPVADVADGSAAVRPLAGISVLLVDDLEATRKFVEGVLEREGAVVDVADSSTAALRRVQGGRRPHYDVVLTGLSTGDMDGCQLAKCLHQRLPAIPVIDLRPADSCCTVPDRGCAAQGIHAPATPRFDADTVVRRVRESLDASPMVRDGFHS